MSSKWRLPPLRAYTDAMGKVVDHTSANSSSELGTPGMKSLALVRLRSPSTHFVIEVVPQMKNWWLHQKNSWPFPVAAVADDSVSEFLEMPVQWNNRSVWGGPILLKILFRPGSNRIGPTHPLLTFHWTGFTRSTLETESPVTAVTWNRHRIS